MALASQLSVTDDSAYGFITTNAEIVSKKRKLAQNDDRFEVVMSVYSPKADSMDVGVSVLKLKTLELTLMSFCDSLTFVRTVNQIQVYEPTSIILPEAQSHSQIEKLKYIIHSNISDKVRERFMKAKVFNAFDGMNSLKLYTDINESTLGQVISNRKLSLAAANACIDYCVSTKMFRVTNKIRLKYCMCENTMLIDTCTVRDLELVDSLSETGTTLYSFLNCCLTKMGMRILRTSILQPSTHENSIILRSESVQELINDEDALISIRSLLKHTCDLEKVFSTFLEPRGLLSQEQEINNIILLKTVLQNTFVIRKSIQNVSSHLLVQVKQILEHENVQHLLAIINEYIRNDCQWANNSTELANQRANAVKSGVNGLLDVSRRIRETLLEEVSELVAKLSEELEIFMEYRFEISRGFFIKIKGNNTDINSLPEVLINRVKKRKTIECTTIELMKQSSRYNDIVSEITTLNSTIIHDMYTSINSYTPILLMVSEAIGTLDLLCSFAYFTSLQKDSYTCPEFAKEVTIMRSLHPILGGNNSNFVANNYSCNHELSRIHVITGANMSGKSVYLRQIAYLVIMAQMGCFVPAEYARMRIFNSLYSRISSDNVDINASLFSKEMSETAVILNDLDGDSLILIDELGRGSSLTDGFSICLAILEDLICKEATVITTTHFRDIAQVLANKSCVVTAHMQTVETNGQLEMKYNLVLGRNDIVGYGIRFAEVSNLLPQELIEDSKVVANILRSRKPVHGDKELKLLSRRRKLVLELYFALNYIPKLNCDMNYKMQLLQTLQSKFVEEINITPNTE